MALKHRTDELVVPKMMCNFQRLLSNGVGTAKQIWPLSGCSRRRRFPVRRLA
jgi:hypothetical protein